MRIRVEVKNEIFGNSIFWEGDSADIEQIKNKPARAAAARVAVDGETRVCGMWFISALAAPSDERAPVEKEEE